MMERYQLFVHLLNQMAENFEVTEANMNTYLHEIEIQGVCPGWELSLTVRPMEVKEDA